jgi:flagellar basal-body rod protein FlgB
MFSTDPLFALLGRAIDTTTLRHAVHVANIANAGAENYHRLQVEINHDAQAWSPADALSRHMDVAWDESQPRVVRAADDTVRLDQEMAAMAHNAVRYQALVDAFERTVGLLRLAVREGREG